MVPKNGSNPIKMDEDDLGVYTPIFGNTHMDPHGITCNLCDFSMASSLASACAARKLASAPEDFRYPGPGMKAGTFSSVPFNGPTMR